MSDTHTIHCLSRAVSRITHMDRVEGNEALIAREAVLTPAGMRFVPTLSANALRHRMIRGPGGRFLVERWDLAGKLDMRTLNFLLHGGSLTESTSRNDTRAVAEFYRLFPLYRLIGGSLPNAILPGSLNVGRGVLACAENAGRLRATVPWDVPTNLRPAEYFVEGYQYTRSDVRNSSRDLIDPNEVAGDTQLMPFSGQAIVAGAVFVHDLIAQHVGPLELGALLLSLSLWCDAGGTIGGQSSRGHGRLDMSIHCPDLDGVKLIADYIAHVDSVREAAILWLLSAFGATEAKPKKKKGAA